MSANGLTTDLNVKRSSGAFLFFLPFGERCFRCLRRIRIVRPHLRVLGTALVGRHHCYEFREVEAGLTLVGWRRERLKLSRLLEHATSILDP